jgi:hypothetical protein
MRTLAVLVLALVLCAPVLAKGNPARLRLSALSPLTAKGAGFHSGEFVRLTLKMGHLTKVRGARATARGTFSVVWRGVTLSGCDWRVAAVGGQGSRAQLKSTPAACQTLPPFDG